MNSYEVQGVIGQGQFGVAYKARHRLDGALYCIKRISLSKDEQSSALKEVQLLSQLDHPNIIAYKESFIDPKDGALCIVTSFCEEGDLFTRIRSRQQANQFFTEQEVMDMFVQIASAIMHIHSKRILHRDLKTQNIFIARGNIIKLGDFGISKVLEKTDQFATTVTGTPYYMAPEICTNQPYTFKSDIWSLGCVLYELCTLKHAFAADSLLSLVYQIVRGNFPPIPSDRFSQGLNALVNRLLVREAAQRPSLNEVFQMPFVQENLHRYNVESKRMLIKQSNTMARRRATLERTGGETMGSGGGTLVSVGSGGGDDSALTPKQRLERKKEEERRRRELELQLAGINMQKERNVAKERKAANIQGSNVSGLPSAGAGAAGHGHGGGAQGQWDGGMEYEDDMVNLGTVPNMATMPNLGTMPGGGGTMAAAAAMAGSKARAGTPPTADPANQTAYQAYENRPLKAASPTKPASSTPSSPHGQTRARMGLGSGFSTPGAGDDDDMVLMGTVAGAGATMAGAGAAMAGAGATMGANMYGNTMVNMGTMNLGGQTLVGAGQTVKSGTASRGGLATPQAGALRPQGTLSKPSTPEKTLARAGILPGSPAAAAVPSNIVNGFKFGLTQTGGTMPSLPAFPAASQRAESPSPLRNRPVSPQPAAKIKFGISSDSQPRGSFEYVVKSANNSDYEQDDFEAEAAGDYESDFEDYNPADDQDTISQKCKILNHMQDLERSKGKGPMDSGIAQVHDSVGSTVKSNKAAQLRDKCQGALGFHFPEVYAYLRRTRTQDTPVDEGVVQRKLQELVGGDRTLLQGCFLVDQLVFQEMMYK